MDRERPKKPQEQQDEPERRLSRREILERTGKYSLAALGVAFGGRAVAGCFGEDETPGCTNTCRYANDGECDDGGEGSLYSLCELGTDCNDCGPRGGSGYTDEYANEYANSYSNGYSNYYGDSYSESYYNYVDYYSNYYGNYYSDFSNSW